MYTEFFYSSFFDSLTDLYIQKSEILEGTYFIAMMVKENSMGKPVHWLTIG